MEWINTIDWKQITIMASALIAIATVIIKGNEAIATIRGWFRPKKKPVLERSPSSTGNYLEPQIIPASPPASPSPAKEKNISETKNYPELERETKAEISNTLASIFINTEEIKSIARESGVNMGNTSFEGIPRVIWHNLVWNGADSIYDIPGNLVLSALNRKSDNPKLIALKEMLQKHGRAED